MIGHRNPSTNCQTISTVSRTFKKSSRLLKSPQFRRVFDARNSVSDGQLIIYGARNDLEFCRLGLAVSKKVGNAVVRNRWKRRIREAFRLQQQELPNGFDFIVLPKRGAQPNYTAIERSIVSLAVKLATRGRDKKTREVGRKA